MDSEAVSYTHLDVYKRQQGEELETVYLLGEDPVIKYKKKEVHLNRLKIGKRDGKGSKARL